MTDQPLYPLRFKPMFEYRLWGGRALGDFMDADLPGEGPFGEAWLLGDRSNCASPVANGALAGTTLTTLMRSAGARSWAATPIALRGFRCC